jgi:hypothetical protein
LIVNVLHCIVFAMCWMSVVLIPAAKVMSTGIWLNVQHPKNVRIYRSAPAGEVPLSKLPTAKGPSTTHDSHC